VQVVVGYEFTYRIVARNTISVAGQFGMLLENFFGSMTISDNTIIGSNVGFLQGRAKVQTPLLTTFYPITALGS
jgi:hypothetical protein